MKANTERQAVSVIGGTGFVGRRLVDILVESRSSLELRVLMRSSKGTPISESDGRIRVITGDLLNTASLKGLMVTGGTAVNLSYLSNGSMADNLQAAQNIAEACKAKHIKRLIHCSSVSVYGNVPDDEVNEESPCKPQNLYQKTKFRIEKLLVREARGNFELVIIRPAAIFGVHGKNLLKLADDLIYGNRALNYLKACLLCNRRMNLVALDNVVAAIVFLIDLEISSSPEVFIVSDDDLPKNSYWHVEKKLMKYLNVSAYSIPVIPIPPIVSGLVLKLLQRGENNPRRRYLGDKLNGLGYRKQMDFDQGLMDFVNWYKRTAGTV